MCERLKGYCSSHYGSEPYKKHYRGLLHCTEEKLTKIMSLPYNSSKSRTVLTSITVPLVYESCRRVTNFIYSCLQSDYHFIRSVVLHSIYVQGGIWGVNQWGGTIVSAEREPIMGVWGHRPPMGSRGKAPSQGSGGFAPWSWSLFANVKHNFGISPS